MRNFRQVMAVSGMLFLLAACGGSHSRDESNQVPTVNAGVDVQINEGAIVNLHAVANDSDGSISRYQWSQISGPTVNLVGADQATLTINTPLVDTDAVIVLRVTVSDNLGESANDDVQLTVKNVATITLNGRVINGVSGAPLVGAQLNAGGIRTTSDANGEFNLQVPPSSRLAIAATAAHFAEQARVVTLNNGQFNEALTLKLLPVDVESTFAANSAKTLAVENSTAAVILPANAFVNADGSLVSGTINGALTVIDPRNDPELMPGDFLGDSGDGSLRNMASLGAINAQFFNAEGQAINLNNGVNAEIRIPAQAREGSDIPSSIPLFYFDVAQKKWLQQGSANLVPTPTPHYVGTVSHFSTWNADYLYTSIYLNGCVQDANGNPVTNIRVISSGDDYNGTAETYTDASGHFHLAARPESNVLIIATDQYSVSNTIAWHTSSSDETLPTCLRLGAAQATIKLTWADKPSDLDSHLFTPANEHIYFVSKGDLAQAPFAALDVDDTTGFGPEVITLSKLQTGKYRYFVHNYSSTFAPGQTESPARVELRVDGHTYIYAPPAGEASNQSWHVFDLDVAANGAVSVTTIGQWQADTPNKSKRFSKNYSGDKRFN